MSSPFDGTANVIATSSSASVRATSNANDFLYSMYNIDSGPAAPGSGWMTISECICICTISTSDVAETSLSAPISSGTSHCGIGDAIQ